MKFLFRALLCLHVFLSTQTFRQKKKGFPEGTLRYDLHKRANASLHSGLDLKTVVKKPPDEDINDWMAVHGMYKLLIFILKCHWQPSSSKA